MKTKAAISQAILFVLFLLLIPFFQNCARGFETLALPDAEIYKSTSECLESSSGACLFSKNAVAMLRRSVQLDQISGYQYSHAPITGLDQSGFLQNPDFRVTTATTPRLQVSQEGLRHRFSTEHSKLEQLMAYQTVQKLHQWMKDHQLFDGAGTAMKVIPDSSFSGWVPSQNELHFERSDSRLPAALDSSLVLSLATHARIWHASAGESHNRLTAKTATCTSSSSPRSPQQCCQTALGCGPALVSGAADFVVARFYPAQPVVGDGWKNHPDGQSVCGRPRDATQNSTLTAMQSYSLCSSRGAQGHVTAMGLVYASLWWDLHRKAGDTSAIEKLFLRHLRLIQGDDDFATIKSKLLQLDTNEFQGRFQSLLQNEFARREL